MKIKEENDSNVGKDKRKRAKVEYSEDEWRRGVMLVGKEEHERPDNYWPKVRDSKLLDF